MMLAALPMLFGCAHRGEPNFKPGVGDAGEFILKHAIARGGQPFTTNGLPKITGAWRYFEDQFGVVVRLSHRDYEAVETLLRLAFGRPRFGPTETAEGELLGGYRLSPEGGGIQFGRDASGTQVIVVRSLSGQDLREGVPRAPVEEERGRAP